MIVQRGEIIRLGTVGENNATEVVFDITEYETAYPGGTVQLIAQKGTTIYLPKTELSQDSKYTITTTLLKGNYFFEIADIKGQIVFFTLDQDMLASEYLVYDMSKADGIYNLKLVNGDSEKNIRCNYTFVCLDEGENTSSLTQDSININGKTYAKISADFEKVEGGKKYLIWLVTKVDTSEAYLGRCYFNYILDDIIKKSEIFDTIVTNSLNEDEEEAPAEYNWVEDIIVKASFIEQNINKAFEAAERAADISSNVGESVEASVASASDSAESAKASAASASASATSASASAASAEDSAESASKANISKEDAEAWAVGTKNGNIIIEDPESENYIKLPHKQNNAQFYAAEAFKNSENSLISANEARAWANGTDIGPEDVQFENNARYYSEEAKKWSISENPIEDGLETFKSARSYAHDAGSSVTAVEEFKNAAGQSAIDSAKYAQESMNWAISKDPIEVDTETFKSAREYANDAFSYIGKAPKIEGGFWWIWNTEENRYENTGVTSGIYIDRTYQSLESMQSAITDTTLKHGAILAISSDTSDPQNAQLYQKIGEPVLNEDGTQEKDDQGNFLYQNFKLEYLVDLSGIRGFSISDIKYVEAKDENGNSIPAGTPGQTDQYTVFLDNGTALKNFSVYNGNDGNAAIYLRSWELDENGNLILAPIKVGVVE